MSLLSCMLYMAKISDWGGAMKKAVTCRAKKEKAKCYGKKCLNRKKAGDKPVYGAAFTTSRQNVALISCDSYFS